MEPQIQITKLFVENDTRTEHFYIVLISTRVFNLEGVTDGAL
jgi:hypothetical protein